MERASRIGTTVLSRMLIISSFVEFISISLKGHDPLVSPVTTAGKITGKGVSSCAAKQPDTIIKKRTLDPRLIMIFEEIAGRYAYGTVDSKKVLLTK